MSGTKRCGSCGWWSPFEPELQPQALLDRAVSLGLAPAQCDIPPIPNLGECGLFECRRQEQVHSGTKLIVTRTGSGEATICTYADFGCVQHEERRGDDLGASA